MPAPSHNNRLYIGGGFVVVTDVAGFSVLFVLLLVLLATSASFIKNKSVRRRQKQQQHNLKLQQQKNINYLTYLKSLSVGAQLFYFFFILVSFFPPANVRIHLEMCNCNSPLIKWKFFNSSSSRMWRDTWMGSERVTRFTLCFYCFL